MQQFSLLHSGIFNINERKNAHRFAKPVLTNLLFLWKI